MSRTAEDYLKVFRGWIGYSEANGKHREIIDIYNHDQPLPRGYALSYNDAWCDATVSAAAIKAGMKDLIGKECGCEAHVEVFKQKGIWIEDGRITPKAGYIIVYNWDDDTQENNGYSDHIGVVETVAQGMITCIEGNKGHAVARRTIPVGWGYIRGYAAPKYDDADDRGLISEGEKTQTEEVLPPGHLNTVPEWSGIVNTGGDTLNVRQWAGTEYSFCSFSPLQHGTKVDICGKILSATGEIWYYIRHAGKYGFVYGKYIDKQNKCSI